jgi:hypothetical protein
MELFLLFGKEVLADRSFMIDECSWKNIIFEWLKFYIRRLENRILYDKMQWMANVYIKLPQFSTNKNHHYIICMLHNQRLENNFQCRVFNKGVAKMKTISPGAEMVAK